MMRDFLTLLAGAYFGAGLFGGLLLNAVLPAINWKGVAFYAATWPYQIYCARDENDCPLPPVWGFSFD